MLGHQQHGRGLGSAWRHVRPTCMACAWAGWSRLNTSLPDMHVRSHEAQKRGGAGKGNWGAAGDEGNT